MSLLVRSLRPLVTLWALLRNPDVPVLMKLLPALGAAYALWPRDLVPDFLSILGRVDDLVVLFLVLGAFARLSAPWVTRRKEPGAGKVVEGDYRIVRTEPRD